MIVEHKRLPKANPLFGSRQGEDWWVSVELSVAFAPGFSTSGIYPSRDTATGEKTLVFALPLVLPLFFRDPNVFTSDLDLTEDFW